MTSRLQSPVLAAAVLAVLTLWAYAPALDGGFVFDDRLYVTGDDRLESVEGLGRIWTDVSGPDYRHQYYPLTSTVFWAQHQVWGTTAAGYHLVNVLLHAVNAVLLWRLLLAIGVPGAWVAAAVFALHPVHVPSVAWIAELKNVLSTSFFLSALLVLVRFFEERPRRAALYAAGAALFACALLSKTATALLPVALVIALWWRHGRVPWRDVGAIAPLAALGAAFVLLTVLLESHHRAHGAAFALGPIERGLVAGRALWFYAAKLLWPAGLTIIYPRWPVDAGAWWQYLWPLAAAGAIAAAWAGRARLGRGPAAAVTYFAAALTPIYLVNVGFQQFTWVADHWQYWASMGLIALVVGAAATHAPPAAWVRVGVPAVVLATLGVLTWQRAGVFRTETTLWTDAREHNPGSPVVRYNLGAALLQEGRLDEAAGELRAVLDLDPAHPLAHNNLGVALRGLGETAAAIEHYREAIRIAPGYARAHNNLGDALMTLGRAGQAEAAFREAVRLDPGFAGAHCNLGIALRAQGRDGEAIGHFREALALDPDLDAARVNLALVSQAGP